MKTKNCIQCGKEKELDQFSKAKTNKFGIRNYCKLCDTKNSKLRRENLVKRQPWLHNFNCAKKRCNYVKNDNYHRYGGRRIKFLLTKNDVSKLWKRDKAYLMKKPSIDREDNDGHYTFDNCRFIELGINSSKDKKKPILQYDLNDNFIKEWDSASNTGLELHISNSDIGKCCKGKLKTCGGFIWRYKDESCN